jgi:hypothetical protein
MEEGIGARCLQTSLKNGPKWCFAPKTQKLAMACLNLINDHTTDTICIYVTAVTEVALKLLRTQTTSVDIA